MGPPVRARRPPPREPAGRALEFTWWLPQIGRLVLAGRDPLGRSVQYEYDTWERLVAVTNPAGGVTRYAYDAQGQVTQATLYSGQNYDVQAGMAAYQGGELDYMRLAAGDSNSLIDVNEGSLLVYNGVDGDLFHPDGDPDDPPILYVGRVEERKGVHVLVEAFEQVISRQRPRSRLRGLSARRARRPAFKAPA